MNIDLDIIKKEEKELNERIKADGQVKLDHEKALAEEKRIAEEERIKKIKQEELDLKKNEELAKYEIPQKIKGKVDVDFPEIQKVDVEFPDIQKVDVDFPEITKVSGMKVLLEKVSQIQSLFKAFPSVFKIEGKVKAQVEFPDIQKVEGDVNAKVQFPSVQKIEGIVKTNVPIIEGQNIEAVPIVFTDGKRLIGNPFQTSVQSSGRVVSVLQDVLSALNNLTISTPPPATLIAFLATVNTAGTKVQLAANKLTTGAILEAPSTNTGLIYVGGSGVSSSSYGAELQPGQSTSVAIDNTNKIYIDSSADGNKVSVLGS